MEAVRIHPCNHNLFCRNIAREAQRSHQRAEVQDVVTLFEKCVLHLEMHLSSKPTRDFPSDCYSQVAQRYRIRPAKRFSPSRNVLVLIFG